VIAREACLDRAQRPVATHAEPGVVVLIAIGRGREEVLAARLDPFHRAAEPPRDGGDDDFFRVRMPLDAEATADIRRQHANARLGQAQRARDGAADGVGYLRRRPHGEQAVGCRRMRDDAARLDRHAGDPRKVEHRFDHDIRLRETARDVADAAPRDARDVVGPVVEDPRRVRRPRRVDAGRGGQRLPGNAHRVGAIGRVVGVVGDDDGHRLADVARHRVRERSMVVRAHRRRRRQRRDAGRALRQVTRAQHRDDAGQTQRGARVDSTDARVRVWAAYDRRVQQPLDAKIVDVEPAPGEQAAIVLAQHTRADGGHHERVAV
jgi:hypothetical protein